VAEIGSEDLSGVDSCQEELEAVAVFGEAVTALHEDSDLEGETTGEILMEGSGVGANDSGLR
jgi:hypothetical protein